MPLKRTAPRVQAAQPTLLAPIWKNQLYCGDCLNVADRIPNESIDLIYIDPPFYSQRYYEMIWGGETAAERFAFEDRWRGGIETYINYIGERVQKLYGLLKPTGTFYIHLDWHVSHYIKIEVSILRQSRRLYGCWPLKGA